MTGGSNAPAAPSAEPSAIERRLSMSLTDQHLEAWQAEGYCIVERFLRPEVIEQALAELYEHMPTWEQFRDGREAWPGFEPFHWQQFPYRSQMMNDLALNPELISFARRALGTDDIMLSHSEALGKYAADHDFDQSMHMDYPNNTFVVPMADDVEQLASITYLTDVPIELGPTRVVSYADGEPWAHKPRWSKDDAPELYERERAITVPAGSIFLYSMRTFHRGSAFTAAEGLRHSIHIAYQRRSMTWGGWRSYVRDANTRDSPDLVTRLTVDQRTMIGFPPPGDRYWTSESIEAVRSRYPEMDMAPYTP
jgi:ectoine hydroxylase-related dioxygenase (phytanoyl-CoA dioxygenase family)